MANRRISVYIPQTNPLTCPIDTFFIVRQTKKSRLSTYLFTQAKKSKSGIPSVASFIILLYLV